LWTRMKGSCWVRTAMRMCEGRGGMGLSVDRGNGVKGGWPGGLGLPRKRETDEFRTCTFTVRIHWAYVALYRVVSIHPFIAGHDSATFKGLISPGGVVSFEAKVT
jgi:hypothetical protein